MLRENLDAVLKDLLELKPHEKVVSYYPGPNLDMADDFLQLDKTIKDLYNSLDKKAKIQNFTAADVFKYDFSAKKESAEIVNRIRRYLDKKSKEMKTPILKMKLKLDRLISKTNKHKKKRIKRTMNKWAYSTKPKKEYKRKTVLKRKFRIKTKQIVIGRKLQMFGGRRKRQIQDSNILHDVLLDIFNKTNSEDPAHGDAALKARFLFKSCMNYKILENRGHQPLLDLLDHLGGWPILNKTWNAEDFDWLALMAKLRLYNNDILISEWVGPDIKNSDEFVIQFDQTSLGVNKLLSVLFDA